MAGGTGDGTGEESATVDLLLDGTDNVATRYLINDVAVKHGIPWVYGGCVGAEGRVMPVRPGHTPCLRCVFPTPPRGEMLGTCDTVGVLGPAATATAALQAVAAIKILSQGRYGACGHRSGSGVAPLSPKARGTCSLGLNLPAQASVALPGSDGGTQEAIADDLQSADAALPIDPLLSIDFWTGRFSSVSLEGARRPDCPCCGQRHFEFLDHPEGGESAVSLCGRQTVQVRPSKPLRVNLDNLASRLSALGETKRHPFFVRCELNSTEPWVLTVFPDGRMLVSGTEDVARARSLYARFIGA
jgi:adenylyltransferase/sulfurtransferase